MGWWVDGQTRPSSATARERMNLYLTPSPITYPSVTPTPTLRPPWPLHSTPCPSYAATKTSMPLSIPLRRPAQLKQYCLYTPAPPSSYSHVNSFRLQRRFQSTNGHWSESSMPPSPTASAPGLRWTNGEERLGLVDQWKGAIEVEREDWD